MCLIHNRDVDLWLGIKISFTLVMEHYITSATGRMSPVSYSTKFQRAVLKMPKIIEWM